MTQKVCDKQSPGMAPSLERAGVERGVVAFHGQAVAAVGCCSSVVFDEHARRQAEICAMAQGFNEVEFPGRWL